MFEGEGKRETEGGGGREPPSQAREGGEREREGGREGGKEGEGEGENLKEHLPVLCLVAFVGLSRRKWCCCRRIYV